MCRPAENPCELAVRQADLIGTDADPTVTPAMTAAAEAACAGVSGCVATSGDCSCPCAVLGTCVCECGGHYLRRCVWDGKRAFFEGVPPTEGGAGPLGVIADALVKVRRVTGDKSFRVEPLPPVDALVGKSRREIEAFLGTPIDCEDLKVAPCQKKNQVFYSFYRLHPRARGGGPELTLVYDDKGVCTDALFLHTH